MTTFALSLDESLADETPVSEEGTYVLNTAHVQEGINHLIEFFRGGPRNQAFLTAILEQVQELENELYALYTAFDPDTAAGNALDLLGRLVGEPRLARGDDEFRSAVRVRVLVNASDGKAGQLYDISTGIFSWLPSPPTVTMTEYYPAALVMEFSGDMSTVTIDTVFRLLNQAKAGGVKLGVTFSPDDPDAGEFTAIWAVDASTDLDRGWGYGAEGDTDQGGNWAQGL